MNEEKFKSGWYGFEDKRIYMRSKEECNWGRILDILKRAGEIKDWDYEFKTFWFEKIKRGTRSYKPDFMIIENDGSKKYQEYKGWLTQHDITRFRRMVKYYPDEIVELVMKRPPTGKSKNAIKQRILLDKALQFVSRVVYVKDYKI